MKVLIIMDGYLPGKKYGGPPISVDNLCSLLDDDFYIVTRDHDLFETERYDCITDGWNDRNNCNVMYLQDSKYNVISFRKIILELQPDIIYLQGIFQSSILPSLFLAKINNIKVLLAPRGELCEGAYKIKHLKKAAYIKFINLLKLTKQIHWQSTSLEETEAIEKLLNCNADKIHHLENVPSIPNETFTNSKKIRGHAKFVFISRIHPKKNLLAALQIFKNVGGKVIFDIYGPIEDEQYWSKCIEVIKSLPETVMVEYKGIINHEKIHSVFSKYDAFFFPTLSENYGHVIAESMIVGTPVIISDQTPWNDINEFECGKAIPLSNRDEFILELNRIVDMDDDEIQIIRNRVKKYAIKKMNIEALKARYNKLFFEILQK